MHLTIFLEPLSTFYTIHWHTGFVLDELSAQGLVLWLDGNNHWHWCWLRTDLKSTQGFWAIGEALVDAVNGRFLESMNKQIRKFL